MAPDAPSNGHHLPALDGLRAVAILFVMGFHLIDQRLPGQFGVTLFFFISGFIITRNLLKDRLTTGNLKDFYIKRFFRLMPAATVYLLVTWLVVWLLGGHLPAADVAATLFYFANYHEYAQSVLPGVHLSPLEMTWSLAVEEHFYLIFPALMLTAGHTRRLIHCLVALVVSVLGWRCWLFAQGAGDWPLYVHTDTRLDSLVYGCWLSAMFHLAERSDGAKRWMLFASSRRGAVLGLTLLVLSVAFRHEAYRSTLRYFTQGVALTFVFSYLFYRPSGGQTLLARLLSARPMTFIGRVSYSLYLYHIVCWLVVQHFGLPHLQTAAITAASALVLSHLSYTWVEQPGRQRAGHWLRKRRSLRSATSRPALPEQFPALPSPL